MAHRRQQSFLTQHGLRRQMPRRAAGSMREKQPGVWELRYRGKSRTFRGSKSAAGRELALMVATQGGRPPDGFTLGDTIKARIDYVEDRSAFTSVAEWRRVLTKRIEPDQVAKIPVDRLNARDLDAYYERLAADGLGPGGIRPIHRLISSSLTQAYRWGWIMENVAGRASPPAYRPPEKEIPDTAGLLAAMVDMLGTQPLLGSLVFVGALTGLRRGELCGLQWRCVDQDARTIKIERQVVRKNGVHVKEPKTGRTRTLDMEDTTARLLADRWQRAQAWAEQCGELLEPDAFVWSEAPDGSTPMHPDRVTDTWNKQAAKHGLAPTMHALRHWNATTMLANNVPLAEVQKRLGHSSPAITLGTYTHALPDGGKAAADTVRKALMPGDVDSEDS